MDKITLKIIILENVEKVWKYYTEPNHIMKWNFTDPSWFCPKAENNLQVGGSFKYRMESKKENFHFDFEGVYDEIIPLKLLKSHLIDGRTIETQFHEIDGKTTEVIQIFQPENDNLRDSQRNNWYAILDNFHKYVENH
ncbi:SRPBCC domain-containing protein [Halpernia sp.]|uniref:SRPBCC domain-containing protein n=1 Tax=Halpernia sp. TaxID=2782209 RepID=UPI003A9482B4